MSNKEALLTREKEGVGSVGASAVTLAKICVGCGVMALPWGFLRGGVLSAPGSALTCVRIPCVNCLQCTACALLVRCTLHVHARCMHAVGTLAHAHVLNATTAAPHTN